MSKEESLTPSYNESSFCGRKFIGQRIPDFMVEEVLLVDTD